MFDSEADRVTDYWEKRGGITVEQVDNASTHGETARVLIKNGEVRLESC